MLAYALLNTSPSTVVLAHTVFFRMLSHVPRMQSLPEESYFTRSVAITLSEFFYRQYVQKINRFFCDSNQ